MMIRAGLVMLALAAGAASVRADNAIDRRSFAGELERGLLRQGHSVTITAEGDAATTMRVFSRHVITKAWAFNFAEAAAQAQRTRDRGFRRIVFDGCCDLSEPALVIDLPPPGRARIKK